MPKNEEWVKLQRKIFSRWCASKLESREIALPTKDIVDDLNGWRLAQLAEILSEKDFGNMKKIKKEPKIRAQQIDAADLALKFVNTLSVEMKVPPSAENVCDKDEKPILGLVWALMRKFIRFSDDDTGPNPMETLLQWVNNKISPYEQVKKCENFTKDFKDGMALCAIIHRHRPKLVDMDALSPANGKQNLAIAFEAAERYFDLEQFLTPDEFLQLDEKSMFVYVSEYFYGVARMRKFEIASKRIARLVDYTKVNDAMKETFKQKAQALRVHLDQVMAVLNNREIDNTMAGAKKKLAEFDSYQVKDKSEIAGKYLNVESYYNHLAMRLSDHGRPRYQPPHETSLEGLQETLKQLEETEKERSVALHKELNRQIKLVQENGFHQALFDKLVKWAEEKAEYLHARETITTTGEASYHINIFNAYESEAQAVKVANEASLRKISKFLEDELYENLNDVKQREAQVVTKFQTLAALAATKQEILDDHLARELFNEKLRVDDAQHVITCETVDRFFQAKAAYFNEKEHIDSVDAARAALSTLENNHLEVGNNQNATVPSLKAFGVKIKSSKYETKISQSKFEKSAELDQREADVDAKFVQLGELHQQKLVILEDDMAREQFKAATRLKNVNHKNAAKVLSQWCDGSAAYLNAKEAVNSIADAQLHLSTLAEFNRSKDDQYSHGVGSLKALGSDITSARYSNLTQWQFETPEEIAHRQEQIDARFNELTELHVRKKDILDDDLAREEYKASVLLKNDRHVGTFNTISAWCDEKDAYTKKVEGIHSIADANLQLSRLDAYRNEQKDAFANVVVVFKKLGDEILSAKYHRLSTYAFEQPDTVTQRETAIDNRFDVLSQQTEAKEARLQAALDLEKRKEAKRVEYAAVTSDMRRWVKATAESCSETNFGFTLAEVEAFAVELDKQDAEYAKEAKVKEVGCQEVLKAGHDLGVSDNPYTKESPESLAQLCADLDGALKARQAEYAKQLLIQRENDALCKKFADAITAFADGLIAERARIAGSDADLDDQLVNVKATHESKEQEQRIPPIQAIQDDIEKRGIVDNVHTFMTVKDVRVRLEQFKTFLERKATMLAEEIELKKLKGLTVEQYEEISKQFNEFDVDKSGVLTRKEIKAALFTLGEEVSNKQVTKIFTDFGDLEKEQLSEDGFKEFMFGVLGVSTSKDEIEAGFKLVNKGADYATDEKMDLLEDDELAFIKSTAPPKGDGWDYTAWTNEVFSR